MNKTTMKAICFTRNGKPDMRLIYEDIGDTPEKVTQSIEAEFQGWELVITGIKEYEDATEWVRSRLERIGKKEKLAALTTELSEHKKLCKKCDRRICGDCIVAKFMLDDYIPCLAEAVTA
jgi:hypothetical protein